MERSFLRREWGAVVFVVSVLAGLIIVPIALAVDNQSPKPAALVATPTPTVSAPASPSPAVSPSAGTSPTATPHPASPTP